ncbi:MAG: hydroxymethylbilane synthase [Rhodoblastus sp.]|nr:hydroxymethylbilane synthase [Rhodoblastus sp.]MCB9997708.1 hydroxymethylbilane synthase [Methylobacteriaceae bacterium]
MSAAFLRIGTRGSPLALAQARETRRKLAALHDIHEDQIELVIIKTTGDAIVDRPLAEAGGKGLFTKELDAAQLAGDIDIAVHSAKDLPTLLPPGLDVGGYLPREDVRDALISPRAPSVQALPRGARVGTASLRRAAQLKRLRPDFETPLLRGNVETRLRKAEAGEIDATLLALAGLKRLGLVQHATCLLEIEQFLPAVGQGAIAITVRTDDHLTRTRIAAILDHDTGVALAAERAFLHALDGSCRTPIAGHARVSGDRVAFSGSVLRMDGSEAFDDSREGMVADAAKLGAEAGQAILDRLPAGVLAAKA